MLKYFLVLGTLFSISFSFFYDSHIGDEAKTEADYIEHPVITGFADTPKEGRMRVSFRAMPYKQSIGHLYNAEGEIYDDEGEEIILSSQNRFYISTSQINIDYYGYKRSGIKLKIDNHEYYYKPTDYTDNRSIQYFSVYFLWGDKFTFPVQNLKSEVGYSDSLGYLITQALDYKISDKKKLSSKISSTGAETISKFNFSSKLICNFSENLATSIMYRKDTVNYSETAITTSLTSIEFAAGLQLVDMSYGYYDFNLKIIPSFTIPIAGKTQAKENLFLLSLVFDFI